MIATAAIHRSPPRCRPMLLLNRNPGECCRFIMPFPRAVLSPVFMSVFLRLNNHRLKAGGFDQQLKVDICG
jgi:hypothetical protein